MSDLALRKQYFDKVVGSAASGKNVLQEILNEQPIDLNKLVQFTSRNSLPPSYRSLVWKLLTGITPRYAASQEYVNQQYFLIYEDLFSALKALKLLDPSMSASQDVSGSAQSTHGGQREMLSLYRNGWNGHLSDAKSPKPEHLLLMWLISEARLLRDPYAQLQTDQNKRYIRIAQRVASIVEDSVDMYHIASSLWTLLRDNHLIIRKAVQHGVGLLRKQNDALHRHLYTIGLFSNSLLEDLCKGAFCEIFPESCIEKIFDKVFAKKFEFFSYIIYGLLNQVQDSLLVTTTLENLSNVLASLRPEEAEFITKSALDQWHKDEFTL